MKTIMIIFISICFASSPIFAQTKAGKADNATHTSYYTCPNHPGVIKYQPGKCPRCGMELNLTGKEKMKTDLSKTYNCPVHIDLASHNPGKCPKCGRKMNLSNKEQMKAEVMKIYTCPMHPDVALDKEGNCPKCGAALVEKKNK